MTAVRLVPVSPAGAGVSAEVAGMPELTGGAGGWEEINRPRQRGAVEWTGIPLRKLSLPLLFDGLDTGTSVEPALKVLAALAVPTRQGQPPVVRIVSPAVPGTDVRWVVGDIAWGDCLRAERTGARVQQLATVSLVEFEAGTVVLTAPAKRNEAKAAAAKGAPPPKPRTVVAPRNATLASIAARELGDAGRWKEIADLNGIRDPRRVSTGQNIKLP